MNAISRLPTLTELAGFLVNRPGEIEGIRQSLYDFNLYPTAGATQFNFFQLPQGQGVSTAQGNAANTKGDADTNMRAAGSLPSPIHHLVTSIEIHAWPGSVSTANTYTPQVVYAFIAVPTAVQAPISAGAANDLNAILQGGSLNFFIGSKSYLTEASLVRFPPKARLEIDAAIASNSATTGTVAVVSAKAGGIPYTMDPPVLLTPTQNFVVQLNYPVAIATPSGFNARVGVILDGYLYRNSQ